MQNTGAHTPIHPYMHTHRSTSHKYILNSLLLEANKFSFPLEFKDSTALRRKCILNSKYIFVVTVFHTARGKIWDRTGTTWGEMFGCYHGGRSLLESSRQKSAGLLASYDNAKVGPHNQGFAASVCPGREALVSGAHQGELSEGHRDKRTQNSMGSESRPCISENKEGSRL